MQNLSRRGYIVKENWPVYYASDLDITLKWFREVLGWYGVIDERDAQGIGEYGWVADVPEEMVNLSYVTRSGIHLFRGEPDKRLAAFMRVRGLRALHDGVLDRGWGEITDIVRQPWGAELCTLTTIDGCELRFYETNNRD